MATLLPAKVKYITIGGRRAIARRAFRDGLCASAEETVQILSDHPVAFTGGRFERAPVKHGKSVTTIANHPLLLEQAAAVLTPLRETPSMCEISSWVRAKWSAPTRSWVSNSQRARRCSVR
jgi:hypothetical protein